MRCLTLVQKMWDRPHLQVLPNKHVQVGTLVIALPSLHEGGQLTVRHRTREEVYDWSLTTVLDEPRVQWAAFYSDCEHEVHKVDSGVRITIVYNLMTAPTPAPYLRVRRLILETLQPSYMGPGILTG